MIRWAYEDWIRAPVTGTLSLLLAGGSALAIIRGQSDHAEHLLIMAMIVNVGRELRRPSTAK